MAFRRVAVADVPHVAAARGRDAGGETRVLMKAEATAVGMPSWVAPRSRAELFSLLEAEAVNVAVRRAAGDVDHVHVGAVRREGPRVFVRPWGGAPEIAVALSDVSGVAVVPAHDFATEAEIRKRQRRGEPAAVLPRRRRRAQAASEEP